MPSKITTDNRVRISPTTLPNLTPLAKIRQTRARVVNALAVDGCPPSLRKNGMLLSMNSAGQRNPAFKRVSAEHPQLHVQGRNWIREHRGIYRIRRFPLSDDGQFERAFLAAVASAMGGYRR